MKACERPAPLDRPSGRPTNQPTTIPTPNNQPTNQPTTIPTSNNRPANQPTNHPPPPPPGSQQVALIQVNLAMDTPVGLHAVSTYPSTFRIQLLSTGLCLAVTPDFGSVLPTLLQVGGRSSGVGGWYEF